MESRSEIVKKFKKLQEEMEEQQELACRLRRKFKDAEEEVNERIIEHYLKHGGLDGRYFKSLSCGQWVYTDGPIDAQKHYTRYLYIRRLINITKGSVTFYGRDFSLPADDKYAEYSSTGFDVQAITISALHPDYEINATEFEAALAEWRKRSDKFVKDLIEKPRKGDLIAYCEYEKN